MAIRDAGRDELGIEAMDGYDDDDDDDDGPVSIGLTHWTLMVRIRFGSSAAASCKSKDKQVLN